MRPSFSADLFRFLTELRANNNREWFLAHRDRYDADVRDPCLTFISEAGPRLRAIGRHFVADPRPSGGGHLPFYHARWWSTRRRPYQNAHPREKPSSDPPRPSRQIRSAHG